MEGIDVQVHALSANDDGVRKEHSERMRLIDMHCHLDFLADARGFAQSALRRGLGFFANTVTPAGYEVARQALANSPNVWLGAGLHPWWIHDGRCTQTDAERVCTLLADTRFVGEVGLDFGKRCVSSRDAQLQAFELIAAACAKEGGRLLSVHAVRSAHAVLDALERSSCLANNRVVFHWFSDSGDALHRAIQAGCWFSVNERMLQTRRGREYARQIPEDRLLLETDLPPQEGGAFPMEEWEADLAGALSLLEQVRETAMEEKLLENSLSLLVR